MILDKTDVATKKVALALNTTTRDVGMLCCKAKKGGIKGLAYSVKENGGTTGNLIAGAEPIHNIYSNEGPSEWMIPESGSTDKVYNRLKRGNDDQYDFLLGSFGGYNSNAREPGCLSYSFTEQVDKLQPQKEIRLMPFIYLGDYDWRKARNLKGNISPHYVGFMIDRKASGLAPYYSPQVELTGQNAVEFQDVAFEIDRSKVGEYTYPTKIILYSYKDVKCGTLLQEGKIDVNITPEPIKGEMFIDVDGYKNVYIVKNLKVTTYTIEAESYYNGAMDPDLSVTERSLYKIIYEKVNRDTRQTVETKEVSSFNNHEMPRTIYKEETYFVADTMRVLPNANEYIRVTMFYK